MLIDHKRGTVYLSGGMEYCPPEDRLGGKWRETQTDILESMGYVSFNITEFDMAYSKDHGNIMKDIRFDTTQSELHRKAAVREHFVATDLKLIINDTDAVILLYDEAARRGAGTISEAQITFNEGIPLFIVSAWENWQDEVPSWLHALSTKIFTSFDELNEYLAALPDGILIKDQYGNRGVNNQYLCSLSGDVFDKQNHHFVSNISPLYSMEAVEVVREIHEEMKNRYEFICEYLEKQHAVAQAFKTYNKAIIADEDLAFSWLSNIAVTCKDRGIDDITADQVAEDLMGLLFQSPLTFNMYNDIMTLQNDNAASFSIIKPEQN